MPQFAQYLGSTAGHFLIHDWPWLPNGAFGLCTDYVRAMYGAGSGVHKNIRYYSTTRLCMAKVPAVFHKSHNMRLKYFRKEMLNTHRYFFSSLLLCIMLWLGSMTLSSKSHWGIRIMYGLCKEYCMYATGSCGFPQTL